MRDSDLVEGNLNLRVTASGGGRDRGGDAFDVSSNVRPPGTASEDDDGDTPCGQVLLVADAAVSREEQIECCLLGSVQERSIAERIPALGLCGVDGVPRKRADQPFRRPVIKEDEHGQELVRRAGSQPRSRARQ